MPLIRLGRQIVELSCEGEFTSVLVTPVAFSLRADFYVELVRSLLADQNDLARKGIEFDGYQALRGVSSLLADWKSRRESATLRRAMIQAARRWDWEVPIDVQWTAMIRRPSTEGPLVIGHCDDRQPLPTWAAPIYLSG